MVFGIDLGTTNSIIGRDEVLYTDLVSSSVNIEKREQCGRKEHGENIVSSYKTDMGLSESGKIPIFCSSVILKTLAEQVTAKTGDVIKDVCISVPAYFATTQREAVKKAAQDAGLNLLRVINEPTAAAIYVCRDKKDYVLVYDLGGGTFDVTLIDTRDGTYQTIATDGEVLGGDDLDKELMKFLIKKYSVKMRFLTKHNKAMLLNDIRAAKEDIQKNRVDVVLSMDYLGVYENTVLTAEEYKEKVKEVFTPTIIKTLAIIDGYVQTYERPKIIYTGGSTYCPYLMELLKEEIPCEELEYHIQRDMLVAHGISYIAKLVEDGEDKALITNVTKQLSVELDDGSVFPIIENNTIIPCKVRYPFVNNRKSDRLKVRLYQGSSHYAAGNDFIGSLDYVFDEVKEAGTGLINVDIHVTYDGFVVLKVFSQDQTEDAAIVTKLKIM